MAVVSKNEDKIARSGFAHPNSILKVEDFSAFVANWNTKSSNITEIIKQININQSSAIFVDDNQLTLEVARLLPYATITLFLLSILVLLFLISFTCLTKSSTT